MRLGIKAHWRDLDWVVPMSRAHGVEVLEYQMLPGDLEAHARDASEAFLPLRDEFELRVHQPEAFLLDGRRQFLDPASADRAIREGSARFLGELAGHARDLRANGLILHGGGVFRPGQPEGTPAALRESLQGMPRTVPLLLENMPWFYEARSEGWTDGRSPRFTQRAEGLLGSADAVDGFVLDVSHAYLAEDEGTRENVLDLAKRLGSRIRHVHASGSRARLGSRGEGARFEDSDYGLDLVRDVLDRLPRDVVVVPETMHGHRERGRLFDEAFRELASLRR